MGTVLDSHFLALTALVTVSEYLPPPPLPSSRRLSLLRCTHHCFSHFGVLGGAVVRLGTS